MSDTKRVGTLELHEDMRFQKREWIAERIGWCIVIALLTAMGLGLFGGNGPVVDAQAGDVGGAFWIRYERFARWQTSTTLEVRVRLDGTPGRKRLVISNRYLQDMLIRGMTPGPESVEEIADDTVFVFSHSGQSALLVVRFDFEPDRPGLKKARFAIEGGPEVRFRQFVYP
jgi:hypothetical protein